MEELLALCDIEITNINYQNNQYYGDYPSYKSKPSSILPKYKAICVQLRPKELNYGYVIYKMVNNVSSMISWRAEIAF